MKKWLAIYDIKTSDTKDYKRLNKVAKVMCEYGTRVQNSVFELEANDRAIERIKGRIRKIMKDEDSIIYFNICESDWQKRQSYGKKADKDIEERNFYII